MFGRAADFANQTETFGAANAVLHRRFVKLTKESVGGCVEPQTMEKVLVAALEAGGLEHMVERVVCWANLQIAPPLAGEQRLEIREKITQFGRA